MHRNTLFDRALMPNGVSMGFILKIPEVYTMVTVDIYLKSTTQVFLIIKLLIQGTTPLKWSINKVYITTIIRHIW